MKNWLMKGYIRAKSMLDSFLREDKGEASIIAIILIIIIVVIALVGIFKTQLTQIVNDLLNKIKTQANGI